MFKVGDKIIPIRKPLRYVINYEMNTVYTVCNEHYLEGWVYVAWPNNRKRMDFRSEDFKLAEPSIPEMILSGEIHV